MSDGENQPPSDPTVTTAPAASAQQPSPRVYTEDEVNAIRQQERNAAAAAARREAEARLKPKGEVATTKAPERAEPTQATPEQVDDYDTRAARRSAFDRAVGKAGLDEDQISLLEIAYKAEKPIDPVEWVTRRVKAFGVAQSSNASTQPSTTQANAPQVNVPPPQPAPSTAVQNGNPDDVTRWNERQWAAYVQQHGANPGNPYHWSNMSVHKDLARKYESSMANKLIVTNKK